MTFSFYLKSWQHGINKKTRSILDIKELSVQQCSLCLYSGKILDFYELPFATKDLYYQECILVMLPITGGDCWVSQEQKSFLVLKL